MATTRAALHGLLSPSSIETKFCVVCELAPGLAPSLDSTTTANVAGTRPQPLPGSASSAAVVSSDTPWAQDRLSADVRNDRRARPRAMSKTLAPAARPMLSAPRMPAASASASRSCVPVRTTASPAPPTPCTM